MSNQGNGAVAQLSAVAEGECVRLVGIEAGRGLAARLAAMGLVPNVLVQVVANQGRGPIAVDVKGTRLALGRGMAHKILVR